MKRDNGGALFKNNRRTNDKAPDYNGDVMVDGTEYRIAAWVKKDKNGNSYFSLSFSESNKKQVEREPADPKWETKEDFDDDLPF